MIDIAVDMLSLKKLQSQSERVKEKWCIEQENDFKNIIRMADELVSSAVCASSSQHSYAQLEQAKDNFIREFLEMSERYRHINS